jgi:hypothetical protein
MNNKEHDVIIIVTIDGREFPTIIDPYGVQRFKANGVVRAIQQSFFDEWEKILQDWLTKSFGQSTSRTNGFQ